MTSAAVISMVAAGGRRSRLRRAVTRYRSAKRLLRTPASLQSRNGLDWTNFQEFGHAAGFIFIAGVAAAGTALAWLLLPETKPEKYID